MKRLDMAQALRETLQILEDSGVDYMIAGCVACIMYGEPRLNKAVEVVVNMNGQDAVHLVQAFPPDTYHVPPIEILSQEISQRGFVNLLHFESGLKVDMVFKKSTAHSTLEFTRRSRLEVFTDLSAWVAAPEDVIIAKLQYFREGQSHKHLTDIRGILANTTVDTGYIEHWASVLGLVDTWLQI